MAALRRVSVVPLLWLAEEKSAFVVLAELFSTAREGMDWNHTADNSFRIVDAAGGRILRGNRNLTYQGAGEVIDEKKKTRYGQRAEVGVV